VRISKQGNPFCYPEHIEAQARKLFAELKANNFLENLEPDEFSTQAAHFLSELNAIHAYREGNGRTQLTFLALLPTMLAIRSILKRLIPTSCSTR
jgi:cell filamentation protein